MIDYLELLCEALRRLYGCGERVFQLSLLVCHKELVILPGTRLHCSSRTPSVFLC